MNDKMNLPEVGTPEEAKNKMKDSYKAFLDVAAKFVSVCDFYSVKENEGKPLGEDFIESYNANFQKLKESSAEDFYTTLASYTVLALDFLDDVKDALDEFKSEEEKVYGSDVSAYDQACDYLAVKDSFTDLINEFLDVNSTIVHDRALDTNFNDPAYDLNAKQVEENEKSNL